MPDIEQAMLRYIDSGAERMHTPGHKGVLPYPLGEAALFDLTELDATGDLFEGGAPFEGVERLFSQFYGDAATLLSAGGCSLAVQGMLAAFCSPGQEVIMLRGCHRSAVSACGLLGIDPHWIAPLPGEEEAAVGAALRERRSVAAVYITSPDYYGYISPVDSLARLCDSYGVPLLVDAAQGAHLTFFGMHPVALGAAAAASSPHKTMPVLTGGALLHLRDAEKKEMARAKMAMFASTSPSYLILLSLDMLSGRLGELSGQYRALADRIVPLLETLGRKRLLMSHSLADPIRITLDLSATGLDSEGIKAVLKRAGISPELVWGDICVLLPSPNSDIALLHSFAESLPNADGSSKVPPRCHIPRKAQSVRHAMLAHSVRLPVDKAVGRVCASVETPCPPGVPVVLPGEIIDNKVANLLSQSGLLEINVVK